MKKYQKNTIYPSVLVLYMKNQLISTVYVKTHRGHLKCLSLELHLNPWFKWAPLNLLLLALAQHNIYVPCSCIILCIALIVFILCLPVLFPLGRRCSDAVIVDTDEDPMLSSELPGKQPHWSYRYNPMFSLLLSFTALRQRDSNCCVLR